MIRPWVEGLSWGLGRALARARSLVGFALAFRVVDLLVLGPAVAWALRALLSRWGRASVGNFEIASFVLSSSGLIAVLGVGTLLITIRYFEITGLMRLLAHDDLSWWRALSGSARAVVGLVHLGLAQLAALIALAVPFLAAAWVVWATLWRGRDLYALIQMRPPVFWLGAGLAAAILSVFAVLASRLLLRWLLALPALLFEPGTSAPEALRRSVAATRGHLITMAAGMGAWLAINLGFDAGVMALVLKGSEAVLTRVGGSLAVALPATAGVLAVHALVAGGLSVVATVTFASLVLAMYRQFGGREALDLAMSDVPATTGRSRVRMRWVVAAVLLGLTVSAALGSVAALQRVGLSERMEITAHRAGAAHAPENTLAALEGAIRDGADWVEVDVVRTSDDALVISHDLDLARFGGGSRRVRDTTLAEMKALDVGTALGFGAEFAGERMPTLAELLAAAKSRMRLNIELKPADASDEAPLTRLVVAEIQMAAMVGSCRVCSQSYRSLRLAQELEPEIKIGFIAAKTLGDVTKLDVDFLMVNTALASERLVARASRRGMEVHAWTVKDIGWVARLLDRGVANLITDDPATMSARLDEVKALDPIQRLLLRVRDELVGDPRG
jgi:glycerophosphoryl diester phosphodiesterase